ncbi:MAG: sortase family protein [Candidatus Sulfotelmatobacter sp.]|nr:sortase family protein [Candidatus Sulfotelmatobacter sp.]
MSLDQQSVKPRSTRKTARRAILRAVEFLCWFGGILAIFFFLLVSLSSNTFQATEQKRLETLEGLAVQQRVSQPGDPFGKISVPRIGVSAIVAEGVDEKTLRHAVGHFPESAAPDTAGTVALAGHRDTFFRGLKNIRINDLVTLETPRGKYRYHVIHTTVVGPEHVELVRSSSQSDLTLVTCFPFHYIGSAPKRFVVQAIRIPADNKPSSFVATGSLPTEH